MFMSRNLNDIFCIDSSCYTNGQLDMAVEAIMDGDPNSAYYHLASLLYDEISTLPEHARQRKILYRFTRLPVLSDGSKPIIDDIEKQALTFANPNDFNDPMDPILREWLNRKKKSKLNKLNNHLFIQLLKSIDNLRICCLSGNRSAPGHDSMCLNPLMWAHYAGMHKGICIEYEISDDMISTHNDSNQVLRMAPVRYRNNKIMNDYITLDNALLAKGASWSYENETRLIYYNLDDMRTTRKMGRFKQLSGFRINSIYLGYRINERDKKDVIKAARENAINVFQVRFNDDNITKLVADWVET